MSRKTARKERFAKENPDLVKGTEGKEETPVEETTPTEGSPAPETEPAPEASRTEGEVDPSSPADTSDNPMDVDGDGDVDANDVAAVANAAAAEAENTDATPDAAEAVNEGGAEEEE